MPSPSMAHTQGEKHMPPQTRADLPCVSRQRGWAGPALFIPDQDIRACPAIGSGPPAGARGREPVEPPPVRLPRIKPAASRPPGGSARQNSCVRAAVPSTPDRPYRLQRDCPWGRRRRSTGGRGSFFGKLSPRDTTGEQRGRGAVKELMFLPCPSPARSPPTASLPASYFASRGFFLPTVVFFLPRGLDPYVCLSVRPGWVRTTNAVGYRIRGSAGKGRISPVPQLPRSACPLRAAAAWNPRGRCSVA